MIYFDRLFELKERYRAALDEDSKARAKIEKKLCSRLDNGRLPKVPAGAAGRRPGVLPENHPGGSGGRESGGLRHD